MQTTTTKFTGAIHPVADLFPMMSDEELDDLAEDIKTNGLIHPVVLDGEGTLIDGRNRLEACRRVGVEPDYVDLDGHEPVAFILSVNVARRHLTKGQAAMAVARTQKLFLKNNQETLAEAANTSRSRVAYAAVVLEYAPDLADKVINNALPLNEAYKTAQERKKAAKDAAETLTALRASAPDLAALVDEDRMALAEAWVAAQSRGQKEHDRRQRHTKYLASALKTLYSLDRDSTDLSADWIPAENPDREMPFFAPLWTSHGLRDVASLISRLADDVDRHHGGTLS